MLFIELANVILLVQKECKKRHDDRGKIICWEICKKQGYDHRDNW